MIEFLTMNELRPVGKQWELKQFEQTIAPRLNSVERYLALLICRFAWDVTAPVIFIRMPQEGDEPIDDVKILRDMEDYEFMEVYKIAYEFARANFGEECDLSFLPGTGVVMIYKTQFWKGYWRNYEYYLTGKDGISIPRK